MKTHPRKAHLPLLAVAGAVLALSGCGYHGDAGPQTSETRQLESFTDIDVEGAAKLVITVGQPISVVVTGSEGSVRSVETRVSGDTLHIKSRPKDWLLKNKTSRLTLQIKLPRLESLQLDGGNDVRVSGIAGGDLKIRASGAANIEAEGQLEKLRVHLSGAGHADLGRLLADEAKVEVDGVGSVVVNPRDSLDATMNGVGAILYEGNPRRVNTRMNGLGTIGQRDNNRDGNRDSAADKDKTPKEEAKPPADPETLQPEYEEREKVDYKSDTTEVI